MKKSYFFLIFLIVILPSCVSKYENSMLKDANLRGSVKSIEETYYDIQYTTNNKDVYTLVKGELEITWEVTD